MHNKPQTIKELDHIRDTDDAHDDAVEKALAREMEDLIYDQMSPKQRLLEDAKREHAAIRALSEKLAAQRNEILDDEEAAIAEGDTWDADFEAQIQRDREWAEPDDVDPAPAAKMEDGY